MAKTIATINLKGGVGKTTITAGLAEFMSLNSGSACCWSTWMLRSI